MIIEILGFTVVLVIGVIILWKFCFNTEERHVQDNQQKLFEKNTFTQTSNKKDIYTKNVKPALSSQSYTTSYQIKNDTILSIEQTHDQFTNKNNQEYDKLKNIELKTLQVTSKYQKVEEQYQTTQFDTNQKRQEYQFQQYTQETQQVPTQFKKEQKQQQQSYQQTQSIPKQFTEEQKQQQQFYQKTQQVTSQFQEEQNKSFETVKQQPIQNTISQTMKRIINNIIPQYIEITEQEIIETQKSLIFLIGQGGIGKTQIFNDICKYKNLKIKKIFKKDFYLIEFDNFFLIDTPKFELNDDIDSREQTIEQFSPIFNDLRSKISAFMIVCKFERTDIMKKNIMECYKFLQNQKHYISLLITDFHLSEDKEADMIELNKKLSLFISNPKKSQEQERILYYDKLIKDQNEKFQKIIEHFELLAQRRISQRFSETIFQNIQSEIYQQEMQNISRQLIQSFQSLQNSQGIQTY